jgi:hypothetical protein
MKVEPDPVIGSHKEKKVAYIADAMLWCNQPEDHELTQWTQNWQIHELRQSDKYLDVHGNIWLYNYAINYHANQITALVTITYTFQSTRNL